MASIVYKPATRSKERRVGKGFSLGELREAGLTPADAKRLGIYVDKRRKSVHPWNVEILKKLARGEPVEEGEAGEVQAKS